VLEYIKSARLGKLNSLRSSLQHWKWLFTTIRRGVVEARDGYLAKKWGAAEWRRRGRKGMDANQMVGAECPFRAPEVEWHDLYSELPAPEDLALIHLQIEELLDSLRDPELRSIAEMKLEQYTNREIAGKLDLSLSTVERRWHEIVEAFKRAMKPT